VKKVCHFIIHRFMGKVGNGVDIFNYTSFCFLGLAVIFYVFLSVV
jgi:hypothetical protein